MAKQNPIQNFAKDGYTPHTTRRVTIDTAARDAGSTVLRRGLALGKVTATSRYKEYNDGNADGTQVCAGLLCHQVDVADGHVIGVLFDHGRVDEQYTIGIDAAAKTDLDPMVRFETD